MAKFKDYNEYISNAQEFAQPILTYLREVVNEACPEVVEEFKWSFPNFMYKGSILVSMAGHKQHVSFGFWLGSIMKDPEGIINQTGNTGMGHFGKIKSMDDLPSKSTLIQYIQHAMELTDEGKKLPSASGKKKVAKAMETPPILIDALNSNEVAFNTFNNFSQSNRNEYIEWITDAKTETTAQKRLKQALEWMEEGKPRNWKYMKQWKS